MASKIMPPFTSKPVIPSRSSSLPHDCGTGQSRILTRVSSTASKRRPLPERRDPASQSPHEPLSLDGLCPDFPLRNCLPSSDDLSPRLIDKHTSKTHSKERSASCSAASRKSMQHTKIQRWSGLTRTVSDWDALRRDSELFYTDGDCYVHLCPRGASQRGPSFCVPLRVLRQKKCTAMLDQCNAQLASTNDLSPQPLRKTVSSLSISAEAAGSVQLFIPAPNQTSREESFRWHITTRNFFALLLGKPLVGAHMGQSFVDLQERLSLYRPGHSGNHQELLDYLENQGYRDLVECPEFALASLYYAEHYKLKAVWIDAFAHCVGMNESVALSQEYFSISRLTKALITRAHLEIELRLNRIMIALGNFLQEDLSPTYLGITLSARSHLDFFRQFLYDFYSEKYGQWPPPHRESFPKIFYKSLHHDFQSLYDYLVDTESTSDISLQRPSLNGGLCVLQNVNSFDQRNGFRAQPYPLPLLPIERSNSKKSEPQKALRQFTLATQHNKTHQLHSTSAALAVATNVPEPGATSAKMVEAYMNFEKVYATNSSQRQEKISAIDARKVRWLLIYGTLQYLTSALQAPKEVRDQETPEYPLCCVAERSSWHSDSKASTQMANTSTKPSGNGKDLLPNNQPSSLTIEPDCNRDEFYPSGSAAVPCHQSSFRSFDPRSLSVRGSRSNSATMKPSQHFDFSASSQNEGLFEVVENLARPVSSVYSQRSSVSILPEGAGPDTSWLRSNPSSARHSKMSSSNGSIDISRPRTPLLDSTQLEHAIECGKSRTVSDTPSRSESAGSAASSIWSEPASVASSKSSADGEYGSTSKLNPVGGGPLGGLVSLPRTSIGDTRTNSMTIATRADIPQSHIHPLLRQSSQASGFEFNFDDHQPGSALDRVDLSIGDSAIGVAVSALSSLPAPGLQWAATPPTSGSTTNGKRPPLSCRAISVDSVIGSKKTEIKKTRSADLLSIITAPTTEMWEQYKSALSRPESNHDRPVSADATPPPISISKITQTFKVPSFRFPSRTNSPASTSQKKENRISSLWRK